MSKNDSIKKVRSIIDSLDRDGDKKVFPDNPHIPVFRTASIPTAEGECLRKWVVKEKAKNAIEIGLAFGFSALHIGEGLFYNSDSPKHTIIDAFQKQKNKYDSFGLKILAKAGLSKIIEFHGEKSEIVLPRLLSEKKKYDFAFVDGCHLFDGVFVDLFYLVQMVKKGGIIFLDDYDKPAIRKAADFFIKNLNWKIEEIGTNKKSETNKHREWLAVRTSEKEDARPWNYFIDF